METRVKTRKASQVIQHIVPRWSFLITSGCNKWKNLDSNLLDVIAIRSTSQFFHCQVKIKGMRWNAC